MGTLYVIGVPAAHPDDITARALRHLAAGHLILTDEPQSAQALLAHHRIQAPIVAADETGTLLAALDQAADRLRAALLGMDETVLAEPLPDEGVRKLLPTKGHALVQVVAAHTAYHAGQLVAWRRAIGRRPVGVFL